MEIKAKLPDGKNVIIKDDSGIITEIENLEKESGDLWIGPGLIDLQVNGYMGVNFTDSELEKEEVIEITQELWKTGMTHYLPTVTTNSYQSIKKIVNVIKEAAQDPRTKGSIVGIHVEGPFINEEDGPRGAHPKKYVRDPSWEEFSSWQEAAGGLIKLHTLAPERKGAMEYIKNLVKNEVVAAIGHTNADKDTIYEAVENGVKFSTHLGNGSHSLIPRHDNYIWPQLACDKLNAGIIVDGHHLTPEIVKTFVRAKGIKRLILTTDMSAITGLKPGNYDMFEREVELREDGKVCLSGTDYLAGSAVEAYECLENIIKFSDVSLSDAFKMSSYNPAKLISKEKEFGELKVDKDADYFLYKWDSNNKKIIPIKTIIKGEIVWEKTEN